MQPLALTAMTVVSAIGAGQRQHSQALLRARSRRVAAVRFRRCRRAVYRPRGRAGVSIALLPTRCTRFDCRNNRLADLALRTDGFADKWPPHAAALWRRPHRGGAGHQHRRASAPGEDAYRRARSRTPGRCRTDFDLRQHPGHVLPGPLRARGARLCAARRWPVSTACASSARSFIDAAHLIAQRRVRRRRGRRRRQPVPHDAAADSPPLDLISPVALPPLRRGPRRHLDRRGGRVSRCWNVPSGADAGRCRLAC